MKFSLECLLWAGKIAAAAVSVEHHVYHYTTPCRLPRVGEGAAEQAPERQIGQGTSTQQVGFAELSERQFKCIGGSVIEQHDREFPDHQIRISLGLGQSAQKAFIQAQSSFIGKGKGPG